MRLAEKVATNVLQDPDSVMSKVEKYGLATVLLFFVLAVAWRLVGWFKPFANRIANEIVMRPGFLEAQAARDAANAARDQVQAELIKQLCERVSTQSELSRTQLDLTRQLVDKITVLIDVYTKER